MNFQKKISQLRDNFCPNCCFEALSFSKKCVTTVTQINVSICFGSLIYTGSPSQKFNSRWVEPFTLSRNAALSLSFGIIRIRYK